MAITHQISLIDLSGDEFSDLRGEVTRSAEALTSWLDEHYRLRAVEAIRRGRFVAAVRNTLRRELGTWPTSVPPPPDQDIPIAYNALSSAIGVARRYRELFIAMADGPFMLLLKERIPGEFINYANRHRRHVVRIHWSERIDQGRTWAVTPSENSQAYTLTFRLPERIADWIFTKPDLSRRRALQVKETYFSDITVYRHIEGEDYLYRLEYDRSILAER